MHVPILATKGGQYLRHCPKGLQDYHFYMWPRSVPELFRGGRPHLTFSLRGLPVVVDCVVDRVRDKCACMCVCVLALVGHLSGILRHGA